MGQYQTDLDKEMDNYDLETFIKDLRWLTHIRKLADEIDLDEKVDMDMAYLGKGHETLYCYTHYCKSIPKYFSNGRATLDFKLNQ